MPDILKHNFASFEELTFHHWLMECKKENLISDIQYQPEPFILSEKKSIDITKRYMTPKTKEKRSKIVKKHLLDAHAYTADWAFKLLTDDFNDLFFAIPEDNDGYKLSYNHIVFVDVKGNYDLNHSNREFSINQKWVYDLYSIYVYKIIPDDLFNKTFAPEFIIKHRPVKSKEYVKTRKLRLKYSKMLTIQQFLKG